MTMFMDKMLLLMRKAKILYFPLLFCFLETVLHIYAYRSLRGMGWILAFSLGFGFLFAFLTTVFPHRVNRVLSYVFSFLITLVYEIQLVYYSIFKGFAPISSVRLGGQAVTNFGGAALEGVNSVILLIFFLLLPFVLLIVISLLLKAKFNRLAKWYSAIPLGISTLIISLTMGIMVLFFSGTPSLYMLFTSPNTPTDVSVENFGLAATMAQEIRFIIFPDGAKESVEELSYAKYGEKYQVDPSLDFVSLYEKAQDDDIRNLTAALSNMPVTEKNKYTGIFEGYNLISICAEAFSPEFIDPELTPTLYSMVNGGFVFENFYASFPNTTTDGEYAFCMGLWPDTSRGKIESSFGLSATNYLPYCYGNVFRSGGAIAKAYHNYTAEFYHRNHTHKNMGYDFLAGNSGLDIEMTWPSSDHEMMVKSVDDYIDSGERFTAYYMTFSGHYQYTDENAMSVKNRDAVKDLDYSDTVKAYIACNLELEYAMTYLLDRLDAAGIADKTLIVLTTDHYPYGLTTEEYAELSGREINDVFDKQKNSFICYVHGMEPVRVSEYCSTVDILPTVLNLLGYTYDSRLLAGRDVLSENVEHVAVLSDGSFIGDGFSYDASKASFKCEGEEAERKAKEAYEDIEKQFRVSTQILNCDYYSFVFGESSDNEGFVDPSVQYKDVEIMSQAQISYVLDNDLMEPESEDMFGVYRDLSIAEFIDILYRVAYRPESGKVEETPFTYPDNYADAINWALGSNILRDDGLIPYDLTSTLDFGKAALLVARVSDLLWLDVTVDEGELVLLKEKYPDLCEEMIRAAMFCKEQKIMVGDGSEEYVCKNHATTLQRLFALNFTYKLCTYMLER